MGIRDHCLSSTLAALLLGIGCSSASAQESPATCPCFTEDDVRTVFPGEILPREEIGRVACTAEDFDVELMAEVTVWDSDHKLVSQARVRFYDYDVSDCGYIDKTTDPVTEREVEWPQPAPEDLVRACYAIIASVVRDMDTAGECYVYP